MPPHGVLQNELAAGCCPADGSPRTQPGLVLYLKVLWPAMTVWQSKFPAAGIAVFLIFVLCRKITDIAKIMFVLWTVMILTTGWVIVTTLPHFDPALAFQVPPGAFDLNFGFFRGLAARGGSRMGALRAARAESEA